MPAQPSQIALSRSQRRQLWMLRRFVGVFTGVQRMRGAGAGIDTERFRYGPRKLETGQWISAAQPSGNERTPVVYVHGGGWICGDHRMYSRDLCFFAQDGRPVANLDYPLAPEHPFPMPLRSLINALAHIRQTDERFDRVHLVGDSAGGNLVAMLGLLMAHPKWLERISPGATQIESPTVASVVSMYGVLDRLSWIERGFPQAPLMLQCYAGPGAFESEVGPELALTPLDLEVESGPPMLLAYGDEDPLAVSSEKGFEHLDRLGVPVHLEKYEGQKHGFFNMPWKDECQRLRTDILRFLTGVDETLKDEPR